METEKILNRIRIFLLWFSIFLFAGTLFELLFLHHTRELQVVPFFLIPLGILLAVWILAKPSSRVVKIVRIGMIIVMLGGIFGMFVHVFGNLEGVIEGGQSATFSEIMQMSFGGRNPLLAPGTLAIAAIVALTALYKHPAEKK